MYRIISGRWKAKKIAAPKNFDVRPTTDYAKEALFSILENQYDMYSISVLDLFAGIGSISLEFASRGCQNVLAIDQNVKHTQFINQTAAELDMALQIATQKADVYQWIKKNRTKRTFEIVFVDAPFDTEEKKYLEIIQTVLNGAFLSPNGKLVIEHQSRLKLENPQWIETRKYGNISFSFYQPLDIESNIQIEE